LRVFWALFLGWGGDWFLNAGMIKQVVYFHGFKVEHTFGFKIELYFTNTLLFWLIFNAVSFVILLKKNVPS